MKRAGVATGIGLSVIALIAGLSLGYKRAGKDVENREKREESWNPIWLREKLETAWSSLIPAKEVAGVLLC